MHRLTVKSVSGVLYILFLRCWLESNVYKSQSRCVGIVHADLRNFYVGLNLRTGLCPSYLLVWPGCAEEAHYSVYLCFVHVLHM